MSDTNNRNHLSPFQQTMFGNNPLPPLQMLKELNVSKYESRCIFLTALRPGRDNRFSNGDVMYRAPGGSQIRNVLSRMNCKCPVIMTTMCTLPNELDLTDAAKSLKLNIKLPNTPSAERLRQFIECAEKCVKAKMKQNKQETWTLLSAVTKEQDDYHLDVRVSRWDVEHYQFDLFRGKQPVEITRKFTVAQQELKKILVPGCQAQFLIQCGMYWRNSETKEYGVNLKARMITLKNI